MATPRKNAERASVGALRIHCPACKSEISSDGSTLHARSTYLEELIETDAGVDDLEKTIGQLEKKLADAKDALVRAAQKEEAASAPKHKTEVKENVGTQPKGNGGGSQPERKRGGDWW